MCFGYDGDAALRESLERKGASRRGLIRGAVAGAAGATVLAAGSPALAATGKQHPGQGHGHAYGRNRVPDRADQHPALHAARSAMTTNAGFVLQQLDQLAKFGYERVERAGTLPGGRPRHRGQAEGRVRRRVGIWASSSHDGISTGHRRHRLDTAKLQAKLDDA